MPHIIDAVLKVRSLHRLSTSEKSIHFEKFLFTLNYKICPNINLISEILNDSLSVW